VIGGDGSFKLRNNTLTDNACSNNDDGGIALMLDSSSNLLYRNNFINNNGGNAYDFSGCTNFWNSSTEGNYYSDYAGCDNDTDGIGDTPHPIPLDGVDWADEKTFIQPVRLIPFLFLFVTPSAIDNG